MCPISISTFGHKSLTSKMKGIFKNLEIIKQIIAAGNCGEE